MTDFEVGDLFVCEDYVLESFDFGEVKQKAYCLKSSVTDFDLTGQIVWPAAIALGKYIVDNKELFAGKNIVELGAGAGVTGLVAAHYAKKVLLTDYMDVVLQLLKKNEEYVQMDNVFVDKISWGENCIKNIDTENKFGKKFNNDDKVDIVMGADVIFWPESLDGLLETLDEALEINPDCLVLISFYSRVKHTNTSLFEKMEKKSLKRETIFNDGDQYIWKITKQ